MIREIKLLGKVNDKVDYTVTIMGADLSNRYQAWAERCGVIPREVVLDLYERRGHGLPEE